MRKAGSITEVLILVLITITMAGVVASTGKVLKNTADHEYYMERNTLADSYLDKMVNRCKDYDGELYEEETAEEIFGKNVRLRLTCRKTGENLYKAVVDVCDSPDGGCGYEKELYFYKKREG